MTIFDDKSAKPMLIGADSDPFDDDNYIFELKLDGERCLAYLDGRGTELRNKRDLRMLPKVPELAEIHRQVGQRCILDGELHIIKEGKPDFDEIKRRSLMSNSFRISLAAAKYPATFTAYDILFYDDQLLTARPLLERKTFLTAAVTRENERFNISRHIEGKGRAFYRLAEGRALEGIVAKHKDSKYYMGRRTREWIKIKNLQDDDFVVCGYLHKDKGVLSIVLGQYKGDYLIYQGHVTFAMSHDDFQTIAGQPQAPCPFPIVPAGHEEAVWLKPDLVCVVKYMARYPGGGLRQPVFKGLRTDKRARECVVGPALA